MFLNVDNQNVKMLLNYIVMYFSVQNYDISLNLYFYGLAINPLRVLLQTLKTR